MNISTLRHTADVAAGCALLIAALGAWRVRHTRLAIALSLASLTWIAGSLWVAAAWSHRGPLVAVLVISRFHRVPNRWLALIVLTTVDGLMSALATNGELTVLLSLALLWFASVEARATQLARVGRGLALLMAMLLLWVGLLRVFDVSIDNWPDLAYSASVLVVATIIGWAVTRRPFERMVVDLNDASPAEALVETLRRSLGDPNLELQVGFAEVPEDDPTAIALRRGDTCVGVLRHERLTHVDALTLDGIALIAGLICDADVNRRAANEALDALSSSSRMLAETREREAAALARRVESGALPSLDAAIELLGQDSIAGHLRSARREILEVAEGLVATTMTAERLPQALMERVAASPIPVTVDVDAVGLSDGVARSIFLVCSEVLTNAIKHARATSIAVRLHLSPSQLDLHITDDGRGGADPSGLGLRGVTERVASFGGTVVIHSTIGHGTWVHITAPRAAVVG